jgi:hypothetical protein
MLIVPGHALCLWMFVLAERIGAKEYALSMYSDMGRTTCYIWAYYFTLLVSSFTVTKYLPRWIFADLWE